MTQVGHSRLRLHVTPVSPLRPVFVLENFKVVRCSSSSGFQARGPLTSFWQPMCPSSLQLRGLGHVRLWRCETSSVETGFIDLSRAVSRCNATPGSWTDVVICSNEPPIRFLLVSFILRFSFFFLRRNLKLDSFYCSAHSTDSCDRGGVLY